MNTMTDLAVGSNDQLRTIDQSGLPTATSLVFDPQKLQAMQTMANAMAEAQIAVPAHFRGKPGDCLAVVMQSMQWGMNPFAIAQKTHLVNGVLGYEAQLVNAVVQTSGAITGRFHYEYKNEGAALECRVGAKMRGETSITWGEWLSTAAITTKNSPLWKTNPKQQLGYLQVKNWARAFAPGAILGVYSSDELMDSPPQERDITGEGTVVERDVKTLPEYPADQFRKNLGTWNELIKSGKKTPDSVIATVSSRYTLTEAQRMEIEAMANPANYVPEAMTYAEVSNELNAAGDLDTLDLKADLINRVSDAGQREELSAMYQSLRSGVEG